MLEKAGDLEWYVVRDGDGKAVLSDLDRLWSTTAEERRATTTHTMVNPELADCPDDVQKALVISFNLPSSCYATMCLRELLGQTEVDLKI